MASLGFRSLVQRVAVAVASIVVAGVIVVPGTPASARASCNDDFSAGTDDWEPWFTGWPVEQTEFGSTALKLTGTPGTARRVMNPDCGPFGSITFLARGTTSGRVFVKLIEEGTGTVLNDETAFQAIDNDRWTPVRVDVPGSASKRFSLNVSAYMSDDGSAFIDSVRYQTPEDSHPCLDDFESGTQAWRRWWSGSVSRSPYAFSGSGSLQLISDQTSATASAKRLIDASCGAVNRVSLRVRSAGPATLEVSTVDQNTGMKTSYGVGAEKSPYPVERWNWDELVLDVPPSKATQLHVVARGSAVFIDFVTYTVDGAAAYCADSFEETLEPWKEWLSLPPLRYEWSALRNSSLRLDGRIGHGNAQRLIEPSSCGAVREISFRAFAAQIGSGSVDITLINEGTGEAIVPQAEIEGYRAEGSFVNGTLTLENETTWYSIRLKFPATSDRFTMYLSTLSNVFFDDFAYFGEPIPSPSTTGPPPTTVPAGVPSAPRVVAEFSPELGVVSVLWEADSNGSPIVEYRAVTNKYQQTPDSRREWVSKNGEQSYFTDTVFNNPTSVRIVACNAVGCGPETFHTLTEFRPTPVGACAIQDWSSYSSEEIDRRLGGRVRMIRARGIIALNSSTCPGKLPGSVSLSFYEGYPLTPLTATLIDKTTGASTPYTLGSRLPAPAGLAGFDLQVDYDWEFRVSGNGDPNPNRLYVLRFAAIMPA
jgi:hypothetical protein